MTQLYDGQWMAAPGVSTRVATMASGESVRFSPEALHDMARQLREGYVAMTLEHLSYLPPVGRWSDGQVRKLADGSEQLFMLGERTPQHRLPEDFGDPFAVTDDAVAGPSAVEATVEAEARNFDAATWSRAEEECPLPLRGHSKWSALPPIEWVITIPVAWGVARFLGSFLDRLGSAAAESLVEWIKSTSQKAREANRDRFVTLDFDLDDGRQVLGFIPFVAEAEDLDYVRVAIDSSNKLAEVAGNLQDGLARDAHRIAYLFSEGSWHLAWFVTDEGAYLTEYFAKNVPSPDRFLAGRAPNADTQESPDVGGEE